MALARLQQQLKKSSSKGREQLQEGYAEAAPFLEQAYGEFAPIREDRDQGWDMYMNSLGLGGQAGYDAALGAYQQGPGFQFALDQANQNVLRNQASLGGLNSGQTLMDLSDRAQQLQNLDFGNWQNRLAGFDPFNVATQQANVRGQQTGLRYGLGQDIAKTYQSQAQNLLGLGQLQMQQQQMEAAQPNGWDYALGIGSALASAAPAFLSDRSAKDNISQVGELYDGTPVYRFTYKGHDTVHIGLMADDVEKRVPDAVHVGADGLKRVDYGRATAGVL